MLETVITLFIIFLFKSMDCSLNVLKNIYLIKDKYFFSALCAAGSVVFFIYTAQQTGPLAYIAIFLATFFGNYLPPLIVNKMEPDDLFVYTITSNSLESGKQFSDMLRDLNIPINTHTVLDSSLNKVIIATVYSGTKTTSRIIENNIPPTFKCNKDKVFQIKTDNKGG